LNALFGFEDAVVDDLFVTLQARMNVKF